MLHLPLLQQQRFNSDSTTTMLTVRFACCICCLRFCLPGGGPKRLRVMLEGESLLNDASGLTLFEVFFHLVSEPHAPDAADACVWCR
jgi:hypothetical protein